MSLLQQLLRTLRLLCVALLFDATTCFRPSLRFLGWSLKGKFCFNSATSTTPARATFDYSSPTEWDSFYQEMKERDESVFEWHSSIPLEQIASYIPDASLCVMVGCGNSRLPEVVLKCAAENETTPPQLVLLDSSEACIAQLRQTYGRSVDYICGDATKLSSLLSSDLISWRESSFPCDSLGTSNHYMTKTIDIIVDKGLTDAILCGEGWNGPLKSLFHESSRVLTPDSGMYLLVSYRLPKSTKEFLTEVGKEVGLTWQFELEPDSNQRVSVSIAHKTRHS